MAKDFIGRFLEVLIFIGMGSPVVVILNLRILTLGSKLSVILDLDLNLDLCTGFSEIENTFLEVNVKNSFEWLKKASIIDWQSFNSDPVSAW